MPSTLTLNEGKRLVAEIAVPRMLPVGPLTRLWHPGPPQRHALLQMVDDGAAVATIRLALGVGFVVDEPAGGDDSANPDAGGRDQRGDGVHVDEHAGSAGAATRQEQLGGGEKLLKVCQFADDLVEDGGAEEGGTGVGAGTCARPAENMKYFNSKI